MIISVGDINNQEHASNADEATVAHTSTKKNHMHTHGVTTSENETQMLHFLFR